MSKNANGRSAIHRRASGTGWEGWVSFGVDPLTGKRRRKHVSAPTKSAVAEKIAKLENQRDGGIAPVGKDSVLADWLDNWIAARTRVVRPNTIRGYSADLRHIKACGVGRVKLRSLQAEHIEMLYAHVLDLGRAVGTVAHIRRTLNAALNTAVKRGYMSRNPVGLVPLPREEPKKLKPYNAQEITTILHAARPRRNGVRWSIAMLGLRQGEVLGLTWDNIDLDAGTLTVSHALTRPKWAHGCNPEGEPICGKTGGYCPSRYGGGWRLTETKTKSGERTIVIPPPVVQELRDHRRRQLSERLAAGPMWTCGRGEDFVVAGKRGGPLDTSTDWRDWLDLLASAKMRRLRIHDLRHSAATYALVMGVDSRTLLGTMGWSSMSLVTRYTHMVPELQQQVAAVQAALWSEGGESTVG